MSRLAVVGVLDGSASSRESATTCRTNGIFRENFRQCVRELAIGPPLERIRSDQSRRGTAPTAIIGPTRLGQGQIRMMSAIEIAGLLAAIKC